MLRKYIFSFIITLSNNMLWIYQHHICTPVFCDTLTFPDHLRCIAIFCASPLPTFGPLLYRFLVFSYRLFWTFVGLYIWSHSPFVRYIATFSPFNIANFPLFILPTFAPCNISGICIFLVHSSLEFCSFRLYFHA